MNAKKCDRCGVFFEEGTDYLILKEKVVTSDFLFGNEYDLCPICQKDFYNFLNKYKEVIKNEKKQSKNS